MSFKRLPCFPLCVLITGCLAWAQSPPGNPVCSPVVTGSSATVFNQMGGSVQFTVSVNPGCTWTIENVPPWITSLVAQPSPPMPASGGTGNGTVELQVAPNL